MSSLTSAVEEFVAMQPKLAWRRNLMRALIRSLGFKVLWKLNVSGLDNVPQSGPTLLMMNHISFIDPVLYMGLITHRYVIPPTKVENMQNPLFAPLIRWWGTFSINRGEVDRKALLNSIELIKSGQLVLIAPEGTRHPEGLAEPKDGMAYIATKAEAVIVPSGISGAIGWEDNLKRFKRTHIEVHFGQPFRFKTGGQTRISREELGVMMREAMYQLALVVPDPNLRGRYSDLSQATTEYLEFLNP